MYRTYIILGFVLLINLVTVLTGTLNTGTSTAMASVGWHGLCSVGWVT